MYSAQMILDRLRTLKEEFDQLDYEVEEHNSIYKGIAISHLRGIVNGNEPKLGIKEAENCTRYAMSLASMAEAMNMTATLADKLNYEIPLCAPVNPFHEDLIIWDDALEKLMKLNDAAKPVGDPSQFYWAMKKYVEINAILKSNGEAQTREEERKFLAVDGLLKLLTEVKSESQKKWEQVVKQFIFGNPLEFVKVKEE